MRGVPKARVSGVPLPTGRDTYVEFDRLFKQLTRLGFSQLVLNVLEFEGLTALPQMRNLAAASQDQVAMINRSISARRAEVGLTSNMPRTTNS